MKTITFDETKWKLVPVEPTQEMVRCAEMWDDGFEGAYARALAATPSAPAQEQWETSPKDGEQWETTPKPVTLTEKETLDIITDWFDEESSIKSAKGLLKDFIAALREKEGRA